MSSRTETGAAAVGAAHRATAPRAAAPAGPAPGRLAGRGADAAILAALLLLQLGLLLRIRPQPRWGDALLVFGYAQDWPDVPTDHHAMRLGTLLPVRALVTVLGPGQVAYYAWPLAMSLLLVAATYVLGRQLFGRLAGALAAGGVAVHPSILFTFDHTTTWHPLPDIPSAALFAAGLAALVAAMRRERAGGAATLLLVLAGACFGWSYLVREFSAFLFAALPVALWAGRLALRRWWVVAAPMLGLLAVELAVNAVVHGDALARLRVGAGHGGPPTAEISRAASLTRIADALDDTPGGTVTLLLLAALLAGAALTRHRGLVLCAAWFLALWVPFTLLGGFLDPELVSLSTHKARYWIPVLPAVLLGAAGLTELGVRRLRAGRRAAWTVPAALVALGVAAGAVAVPALREAALDKTDRDWNALRVFLLEHEDFVTGVGSDPTSAQQVAHYAYPPVGHEPVWDFPVFPVPDNDPSAPPAPSYPRVEFLPPVTPEQVDRTGGAEDALFLWSHNGTLVPPREDAGWVPVWSRGGLVLFAPRDGALAGEVLGVS